MLSAAVILVGWPILSCAVRRRPMNTAAIVNEKKLTYYMIAKFTTDTPISNKEAEAFIKLAIKDLGEGSEVELFQMGELWHD